MSSAALPPPPAVPTGAPGPPGTGTGSGEFPYGNDNPGPMPPGIPISPYAAHMAQVYLGVTITLLIMCIVTFCTRMYNRIRPVWKIGADDYFIVAGFILTVADWALLLPLMVTEPGLIPLERGTTAGKHSWLAIPIWGMSMTCIKISIALTLLRIQGSQRSWRIFLYTIMAVQAVYGIGNVVFDLAIACQPLAAAWDPFSYPDAKCVSIEVMRSVSNVGSAINITTDVLLSLAPATFLRKLNRPLRERIFVCVLMGMGILASVSSIVKTVIIKDWGDPTATNDWWAMGVSICTCTALEQLLGVLAACVPAMKATFQKCLGAMGYSLTEPRSAQRSGYYMRGRSGGGVVGNSMNGGVRVSVSLHQVHHRRGPDDDLESGIAGGGVTNAIRYARKSVKDDVVVEYEEEMGLGEITRKSSTTATARSVTLGSVEQLPRQGV